MSLEHFVPTVRFNTFCKKTTIGNPRPLFCLFSVFSNKLQFLQQINAKNIRPIHGAGFRTHDLLNMSRLP